MRSASGIRWTYRLPQMRHSSIGKSLCPACKPVLIARALRPFVTFTLDLLPESGYGALTARQALIYVKTARD